MVAYWDKNLVGNLVGELVGKMVDRKVVLTDFCSVELTADEKVANLVGC